MLSVLFSWQFNSVCGSGLFKAALVWVWLEGHRKGLTEVNLLVGKVYKLAVPEPNDGDLLRVIDESGEDYLYPASYFEPLIINDEPATDSVTTHLPPWLKGVLYAEAVAADKPVSVLLREWIEERLDLPTSMQAS